MGHGGDDQAEAYGRDGVQPIVDAILQQFQTLNVSQTLQTSYAIEDAANPADSSPPGSSPPGPPDSSPPHSSG